MTDTVVRMGADTERPAAIPQVRLAFQKPVAGRMTVLAGEGDSRAVRRFKVFKPGHYSRDGASAQIHLLDISAYGAKAHAQNMPRQGDQVLIECGFSLGKANVLWVSAGRFGLKFAVPLSHEVLAKLLV